MKVLIVIVCSLSALARASLEPAGYVPPGSYPQSSYLLPSSSHSLPENRYVASSVRSVSDAAKFNNQVSSSLSVPSKNSPVPFARYLSANRQQSHRGVSAVHGSNIHQNLSPASQYFSSNDIRHSFVANPPASDYLPPKQDENRVSDISNVYLAPNVKSGYSSDEFTGQLDFASTGRYSKTAAVNRHSKISDPSNGHYSLGQDGQHFASRSPKYRYNAPENHIPAKYEFQYKVKDNYGNDYSHEASQIGENTQGVYTVLLPDGRKQIVHYEADSHGYRPTITYEETGSQSGYNNHRYQYK